MKNRDTRMGTLAEALPIDAQDAVVCYAELVCWPDLGSEAVRRLTVRDLPLTVAIDSTGGDLYQTGLAAYREAARVQG